MKIIRTVFMGTPEFAVEPLRKLVESGFKPELCITQPDRPSGRKKRLTSPALKVAAESYRIEIWQPENINEEPTIALLRDIKPDLIITAAYGGYIGRIIRKIPLLAAINIHPSLLPRYRGATPINSALWNGDRKTGVSIFRLTARMDAGPILSQSEYNITEDDNYTKLLDKLSQQGAEDLIRLLQKWEISNIKGTLQDERKAIFCRKLQKDDLRINWEGSAGEIYNQVRALAEKPGAVTEFRGSLIKIIKCRIITAQKGFASGIIIDKLKKEGIIVSTGDGTLLVEKVQPAGKSIMNAYEFDLGARIRTGERFI
ncbi:MAG: methionyl-tRNA formyltransferase [Candidatus Cloacimonetes bacterium]|nr:methionyl-tRNA formyltransferase [Candidatus Cloacimonadota bacterium]